MSYDELLNIVQAYVDENRKLKKALQEIGIYEYVLKLIED